MMFPRPGGRQSFLYPESTWPSSSSSSSSSSSTSSSSRAPSSSSSSSSSRSFVNANISSDLPGETASVDSIPSSSGSVSSCRKRKLSEREKARKVEIKKKHMMEIEAPVINVHVAISGFPATKPVAIDNTLGAGAFMERNSEIERKVTKFLSLPTNEPTAPVSSRTGELKRKMVEMERAAEHLWKNDKKRARLNEPFCSQAMNMFLSINTAILDCRRQTDQTAYRYSRISQSGCLKRGGGFMENVYGCPPIKRRLVL